jgi:hypothetical protein
MTTKTAAALFTALVLGTVALTAAANAAPRQWNPYQTNQNLSDSIQNSSSGGF